VEKYSAVVTTVFVHPWMHPYVVLFVCLASVKQLKFVLHLLLNKCSVYIFHVSGSNLNSNSDPGLAKNTPEKNNKINPSQATHCALQ